MLAAWTIGNVAVSEDTADPTDPSGTEQMATPAEVITHMRPFIGLI